MRAALNKRGRQALDHLASRALEDAIAQVLRVSAHEVARAFLAEVQKTTRDEALANSLRVSSVRGFDQAFAVHAPFNAAPRRVGGVGIGANETVVLYVRPRRQGGGARRIPADVEVLEQYNPWTPSTLPFTPARAHAELISRRVRSREVRQVSEDRAQDRARWSHALKRAGRSQLQTPSAAQAFNTTPDLAFETLRAELGISDEAAPVWRPALALMRARLGEVLKPLNLGALFGQRQSGYRGPRQVNPSGVVDTSAARELHAFMAHLGL